MTDNIKDSLEKERMDRLKELGYLCYNLSLGNNSISEYETTINVMRTYAFNMTSGRVNNREDDLLRYSEMLNEKATELGCACFNRYIDNELTSGGMMELCASISEINSKIAAANEQFYDRFNDVTPTAPEAGQDSMEYNGMPPEGSIVFSVNSKNPHSDLRINYPYGMEPIPTNAKICACGYRNRSYAVYCGKCGAKL